MTHSPGFHGGHSILLPRRLVMPGLSMRLQIPDEVSFQPSEFTGLTEQEAHSLFQRKDTTYLRS